MKKLLLIVSVALLAAGCSKGYVVDGNIEGLEGKVAIKKGDNTIAETEAAEGKFTLKGVLESPDIYVLSTDSGNLGLLFLENGAKIDVAGKLDGDDSQIDISGTVAHDKLAEFNKSEEALWERMEAAPEDEQESIYNEREANIGKIIEENIGNMFGIYMLRSNFHGMEPASVKEKLDLIPAQYRTMPMVEDLSKIIDAKLNTDTGKPYIDFSLPDMEGNEVALSSVIGEGKYVLLDFWASWCGPCMGELPYLKAAYETYHPKGLEIFGVSLDRSKEDWVECVNENAMNWHHVSAVQFWDCPAAKLYGVASIPASYLIGPDGTIVAKNLRGEELAAKLAELLGTPAGV